MSDPDKIVFVVMGNDYPSAVFDTATAAEAFCAEMRKKGSMPAHRIHWRTYAFRLNCNADQS